MSMGKLFTLISGDLRVAISKPALEPLDLFRAQPALLEERSYALKARVSQEVLEGFVAVLYDPSEKVDINWRNAAEFRSLAQELGFHGFDARLESAELSRPGGDTGSVSLEIEMYKRQIEAPDARICKLEAQLAEVVQANEDLRKEVRLIKSSAASMSHILLMREMVETVETELSATQERMEELEDHIYETSGKVKEIEIVTDQLSANHSTTNARTSAKMSGSGDVSTERPAMIPTDVEANMSLAQVVYGMCAEFGFGSECSLEEAVKLYKAAAEQGNAYAQLRYGQCLFEGKGVAVDHRTAFRYFEKSAEQGNSTAMFFCGQCCEQGKGTLKFQTKAAQWYKQSADLGNSSGQYGYGRCLESGIGVERDLKEAARLYKLSADQKNPNGQYRYGDCLENGRGVTKDVHEAADYYRRAALQGHSDGQAAYGQCLSKGIGVPQNKALAVRYFRMASDSGSVKGQLYYATALDNGDGVPRNFQEALRYFKLAAEQGSAVALVQCGWCYWKSNDIPQDLDGAEKYLRKAADQRYSDGQYYYAMFLEENNKSQGRNDAIRAQIAQYYKLAADQFLPAAENAYGRCLQTGLGVERDLEKAAEYYLRASNHGDMNGHYNYACFLISGEGNVKKDLPKAVELLMNALRSGHSESRAMLAEIQKQRPELIPPEFDVS